MHLHGFHFLVDAAGDGQNDEALDAENRRTVVTEQMEPGRTISLTWTPTRPGRWLFHCHMLVHMHSATDAHARPQRGDDDAGMAGLVIGIEVAGPQAVSAPLAPIRRLVMVLNEDADRYGKGLCGYRVDLEGAEAPRLTAGQVPGPVLVLYRGEPTEITIVNRTTRPTAIHWHGMEIDSYFDGVPGFGGDREKIAPPVAPGESFVVNMTPPRSGTFMYHTHWHEVAQLAGGLYGPLIVLEPGQHYDPATDHILMVGYNGVIIKGQRGPYALNGLSSPEPILMRAGVPHRLRLINITPNNVGLTASLMNRFDPVQWKLLAKDGAEVAGTQMALRLARQLVSVGETYDFEFTSSDPQDLWFDFRTRFGGWVLQAQVQVR
jgi:FtsP/CotA-like multicopper oxidase with cupredoxin domain